MLFVPPQLLPADPGPMIAPYPSRDDLTADVTRFVEPLRSPDVPREIDEMITDDDRTWCKRPLRLDCGKPYRRVLEMAREKATDLIVMGVAGRGPLDMMFFGYTTNHVVRRATCPVLTLRAAAAGD